MNAVTFPLPAAHPKVTFGKVGVLLVNLGTPDGTDYKSMRRYLAEFLSDKRVIEWSRLYWYPILYGIVLNKRPQKVGKAYEAIWNKDLNESYLRTYTRSQGELMAERLKDLPNVEVDWGMRYGKPSIAERIDALKAKGCEKIVLFPLYPQYAASTTATVNDKAFEHLMKLRWQPALRTVAPYHDDPAYITALANSVRRTLATLDWEPQLLITSFHGIPQSYFKAATPITVTARRRPPAARGTRLYGKAAAHHLPVPFRAGRMAAALYRQDDGGSRRRRHQARRHHEPWLRLRLSGNAGRDCR